MGLPRVVGMPNEYDVQLQYASYKYSGAPGALFYTTRMRPNCPYDFDPTLGSTATPVFSELAGLYQYSRTIAYEVKVTVNNNSAVPGEACFFETNVDPGVGGSLIANIGNPFSQLKLVARQGCAHDTCHFTTGPRAVSTIVGSSEVEKDDNFASLNTTIPANQVWVTCSFDGTAVGTNVTQISMLWEIRAHVRFYERKLLSS